MRWRNGTTQNLDFHETEKKFERFVFGIGPHHNYIYQAYGMNGSKKNHRKSYRAQRFGVYVWFITNEEYDRIERKRKGKKKTHTYAVSVNDYQSLNIVSLKIGRTPNTVTI